MQHMSLYIFFKYKNFLLHYFSLVQLYFLPHIFLLTVCVINNYYISIIYDFVLRHSFLLAFCSQSFVANQKSF